MGAGQSRSDEVFHNETPIQFSQDVVNHLSDYQASPETSPQRQTTLDAHIRSRIQAELEHLHEEEDKVREEIEQALEKENLDRELSMAGKASEVDASDSSSGDVKSGVTLLNDLEDIRQKVDRFQTRRELSEFPQVKTNGEALVSCYKANVASPLDCWKEVQQFKASVTAMEQQHFHSLQ